MLKSLIFCLMLPIISFAQLSVVELELKSVPAPFGRDKTIDVWNQSQAGFNQLSEQEKDLLYWTNYSRANPKRFWDSVVAPILNAFPSLKGKESQSLEIELKKAGYLSIFKLNTALTGAAKAHANDIARKKAEPSHTSTDGTSFGTRMKKLGIKRCANENMALGNHNNLLSLVLLYLDIGLDEKGHRNTLLNPSLTEIGVGYANYGKNQFFIVQDFACSQD